MNSLRILQIIGIAILLSHLSSWLMIAQDNTRVLSFDYYSQIDGLPNNQVQCIYQDRKGWIWIGTSQVISRFDGYRFVNFLHNPEDTNSISGNLIRVIFEDNDGNLLVGTENGGLNIYDRDKERFRHPYKDHPEFSGREVSVNTLAANSSGNFYLGTERGILKIDSVGHLSGL